MKAVAKGARIFVVFYVAAWTGWFALFTGGDFERYFEYFLQGWTIGVSGTPLLTQVFALGTAIVSSWALYALERLEWF